MNRRRATHFLSTGRRFNNYSRRGLTLEWLESRDLLSVNITTYHGDNSSTGQNLNETTLTPANVNPAQFGKLSSTPVDGQVYAQPLIMTGITTTAGVNKGLHNVAYIATQNDSLYAIDSDTGVILWQDSFTNAAAGITAVPYADVSTADIQPTIGITSTPVIDPAKGILYLTAKTKEVHGGFNHYVYTLHAVNIASGADTPVVIADTIYDTSGFTSYTYVSGPTVNGTGDSSVNGTVYFNALRELQRPALTLAPNGNLIIAFGSHGSNGPYHGWVLSYATSNLQLNGVLNTSPNGSASGIWQGGGRVVMDAQGYMYFNTGNGPFDTTTAPGAFPSNADYGDSLLKVGVDTVHNSPTNQNANGWGLQIVDYFTPHEAQALDQGDRDLASGAPLLLPDSVGSAAHPHLILTGGKEGIVYLVDTNNMGKFDVNGDHVVQELVGAFYGIASTPTYFNGAVYIVGAYGDKAKQYSISNATLSAAPTSQTVYDFTYPGGTDTISANGSSNAMIWGIDATAGVLRVYSAASYTTELYRSDTAPNGRDSFGTGTKFTTPTVANGKVYIGSVNAFTIYGLLANPVVKPAAPTGFSGTAVSSSQVNLSWTDNSNNEDSFRIESATDGGFFYTAAATTQPNATSVAISGLNPSTTYTFRVYAYNVAGASAYANIITVTTPAAGGGGTSTVDFSSGFTGAASQLTLAGSAQIVGSRLRLTDGNPIEASSAWSTGKQTVSTFTNQFTFQDTNPVGDGFVFAIQNKAPNALGSVGGPLGYGNQPWDPPGVTNSVAIKFDIFSNSGEGPNSTGLYINGAMPTNVGSIDLTGTGIDFHSGHVFNVQMSYDGTTLTVIITDTTTNATATQSYVVNIPSIVGGNSAYVGFTAGSGQLTATQDILTWKFGTTAVQTPNAPSNLAATATSSTQINLTWTDNATNETGFALERKTGATGTYVQIATIAANTTAYSDTSLTVGTQYYYRLRTVNNGVYSSYSNEANATTLAAPLTPTNGGASLISTNEIDLYWTDNANNEDGYKVIRRDNSTGQFNLISTLPPNSTSYKDTGLLAGTLYDYHIQAFNSVGYSDYVGLAVYTLPVAPTTVTATASTGQIALSWVAPVGAVTYNIYRSTTAGGEGATALATGVTGTTYTDSGLVAGTSYYYVVTAVDNTGEGARSAEASATVPAAQSTGGVDFSGGFAGAAGQLTLSGSTKLSTSKLRITDGAAYEAGSAWTVAKQTVTTFTNQFTFQDTTPNGDGFLFVIQNKAPNALGSVGGPLGYGNQPWDPAGVTNSVAIKFDIFSNSGEGPDSTGLYTNGAMPTNLNSIDLSSTGVDFHSGHVFNVLMNYDGTTLKVVITDTTTNASATQNYTVNIPSVVGGNTAYVGFTGASGALTATQDILTWKYTPGGTITVPPAPTAPPAPTNLMAVAATNQVTTAWSFTTGATSYNVYRSTTPGGEGATPIKTGLTATYYVDPNLVSGITYYYQVTAVNAAGEGPKSVEVSATTPGAPPTTVDFSNGFLGAASQLTLSGNAQINGTRLRLTDGGTVEASSVWSYAKQTVSAFNTQFTFQDTTANGDGFVFAIQNKAPNALGSAGAPLGYGNQPWDPAGVTNSVAIKFDIFSNSGEGPDSTGLYTNGANPTNVGSVDLSSTGVDFHSGHVFNVAMTYDGTTLKVTITDTTTNATATQNYTVNIPSVVGASTAYVGFTAGSGLLTATQEILTWKFNGGSSVAPSLVVNPSSASAASLTAATTVLAGSTSSTTSPTTNVVTTLATLPTVTPTSATKTTTPTASALALTAATPTVKKSTTAQASDQVFAQIGETGDGVDVA